MNSLKHLRTSQTCLVVIHQQATNRADGEQKQRAMISRTESRAMEDREDGVESSEEELNGDILYLLLVVYLS